MLGGNVPNSSKWYIKKMNLPSKHSLPPTLLLQPLRHPRTTPTNLHNGEAPTSNLPLHDHERLFDALEPGKQRGLLETNN